jgi:uncharacterized repeat protein (TIGR01451 family)
MNQKGISFRLAVVALIGVITLIGMFIIDRVAAGTSSPFNNVLFSDDFSGDLSQWSIQDGNWYIDQGELVAEGFGAGSSIYAGDTSWTNYSMQVKVVFGNPDATIVLRSTGSGLNEYILDFWTYGDLNSNKYQISKYQDGQYHNLSGGLVDSPVPITNPSVIMVQVIDDRIILYVNGQYLSEFYDPEPLLNGRIGLGTMYANPIRFDDVVVSTLPPVLLVLKSPDMNGRPGDMVAHTIELANHTGETDSFTLTVQAGNVWTTTLPLEVVGPLNDGERFTFDAWVQVPPGAQSGEFDIATIEANSVLSPGVITGTVAIKTIATGNNLAYVTQSTNTIAVIDRDLQQVIDNVDVLSLGCLEPWRARLTPSGSTLYVLCNGQVNLIALTVPEFTLKYSLFYSGGYEDDIVFTADERYAFISTGNQKSIQVLDIDAQSIVTTIPLEGMGVIKNLDVSPTGTLVYASGISAGLGRLYVIDARTFEVISMIDYGHELWDVVAAADNQYLYVGDRWGSGIAIIDAKTYKIIDVINTTGELTGLALSSDGRKIFAGEQSTGTIYVYDIPTHKRLASVLVGGTLRDITMDCSGRKLYIASWMSVLSIVDVNSYTVDTIQTPGDSYGVAICPQYQADIVARKIIGNQIPHPGGLVDYTITMGSLITSTIDNVIMTDTLPISLTYKEGSLSATSGMASYQNGVVTWTGSISPGTSVSVSFEEVVPSTEKIGTSITNEAIISANGKIYYRNVTFDINPYPVFIPCASRACPASFYDDFSNPASGWEVGGGEDYSMGYANGEYYIGVSQGWIAWSMQNFGVSDYRVEVDERPSANLDGATGIMFEINEYGFYLLEVSDGWYALWSVDAYYWDWTPLIDWTYSSAIRPGLQTNRMGVERVGNDIAVYANNKLLGSVYDSSYHGTWIGLTSSANTAYFDGRFDNFAVYTGSCIGSNTSGILFIRTPFLDPIWAIPGSGHTRP